VCRSKREHTTEAIAFSGFPAGWGGDEVLFEEPRKVDLKDGQFSDWFAPFDVHFYRFNPIAKLP